MANFFTKDKSLDSKTESDNLEPKTDRPARKSKIILEAELKAGRWVAPIILLATMLISGVLWLIKNSR